MFQLSRRSRSRYFMNVGNQCIPRTHFTFTWRKHKSVLREPSFLRAVCFSRQERRMGQIQYLTVIDLVTSATSWDGNPHFSSWLGKFSANRMKGPLCLKFIVAHTSYWIKNQKKKRNYGIFQLKLKVTEHNRKPWMIISFPLVTNLWEGKVLNFKCTCKIRSAFWKPRIRIPLKDGFGRTKILIYSINFRAEFPYPLLSRKNEDFKQ